MTEPETPETLAPWWQGVGPTEPDSLAHLAVGVIANAVALIPEEGYTATQWRLAARRWMAQYHDYLHRQMAVEQGGGA